MKETENVAVPLEDDGTTDLNKPVQEVLKSLIGLQKEPLADAWKSFAVSSPSFSSPNILSFDQYTLSESSSLRPGGSHPTSLRCAEVGDPAL